MRAVVRRHRLKVGDRLVYGPPQGTAEDEVVTIPIVAVGEHTVVLLDGTIVPVPPEKAVYIERAVDEESMLAVARANDEKISAD